MLDHSVPALTGTRRQHQRFIANTDVVADDQRCAGANRDSVGDRAIGQTQRIATVQSGIATDAPLSPVQPIPSCWLPRFTSPFKTIAPVLPAKFWFAASTIGMSKAFEPLALLLVMPPAPRVRVVPLSE